MMLREYEIVMCARAQNVLPLPEFQRACGDCICPIPDCGRSYFDHPNAVPWLWLRILCDGRYVKL